jgi:hypothetical protein
MLPNLIQDIQTMTHQRPHLPYTREPFNPRPKPEAERPTRGRYRSAGARKPKSCTVCTLWFPFASIPKNERKRNSRGLGCKLYKSWAPPYGRGGRRRWSGLTPPTRSVAGPDAPCRDGPGPNAPRPKRAHNTTRSEKWGLS